MHSPTDYQDAFSAIILPPLAITLPLALIWYAIGRKRNSWHRAEVYLAFLPWIVPLGAVSIANSFTTVEPSTEWMVNWYANHGMVCALIGGLVLLPRLFVTPQDASKRFLVSLTCALAGTGMSLLAISRLAIPR
jgi:hypothetical protein